MRMHLLKSYFIQTQAPKGGGDEIERAVLTIERERMKEVEYALARKGDEEARPEIKPAIIEGPPIVAPSDKLKHLHFNDRLRYFIGKN